MTDPGVVVDEISGSLQPLELAAETAWWASNTDATAENEAARVAADVARSDLLADPDRFASLRSARAERVDDPVTLRQLEVLEDTFLPHQVPAELRRSIVALQASIEADFVRHRGVVGGDPVDDNAIRRILRESEDPTQRREAWEASKSVGTVVAERVRELVRLRNRAARVLGFSDYFTMALATSELDYHRLMATLGDVDHVTRESYSRWKSSLDARLAARFGIAAESLMPWHYDDPFLQSAPDAADLDALFAGHDLVAHTLTTFDSLGLDVRPILDRSDLFPRAGKNQHAFCVDIDRGGDVRVLANVTDNELWMETLLHEFGHAAYFAGLDGACPWLLRTMHPLLTEGVAMMFGRLTRDPGWLTGVAGVAESATGERAEGLSEHRRAGLLVFVRWVLVMTNFERGLYGNPERDLDAHWWDLVEHYQHVRRPPGRQAPDWAAKIHVALTPVYYQNYLYGEMFASQLGAALRRECGGLVGEPAAGDLLRAHVFRPGSLHRWDRLVALSTGSELDASYLGADIGL